MKLPSVDTLITDSFRPDTMDHVVSGGAIDHTQLTPGRFKAAMLSAGLEDARLDWAAFNLPLLARGELPAGKVTLACLLQAAEESLCNGWQVGPATPFVFSEGAEVDYKLAPQTQWATLQVSRDALERSGIFLPSNHAASAARGSEAARELQQGLQRAIRSLSEIQMAHPDITAPAAFALSLQEDLFGLFCSVLGSHPPSRNQPAGHRRGPVQTVRQATEFIDAHLREPFRVVELCRVTGVSWKSLERSFDKVLGVTPKRYLTLRRLSRARRQLLAASPTEASIAAIAAGCGLYHAGRFSIAYRELFGETPTATLERRAAPAVRFHHP